MKIRIRKSVCSGCHLCEMVCSLVHTGAVNTEKSAIRILKDDLGTSMNQPILCRQCKTMSCFEGEEVVIEEEVRKFFWPAHRAERCPFHALPVFAAQAYHCDLCGGDPQCLTVCTSGALSLVPRVRER